MKRQRVSVKLWVRKTQETLWVDVLDISPEYAGSAAQRQVFARTGDKTPIPQIIAPSIFETPDKICGICDKQIKPWDKLHNLTCKGGLAAIV